MRDEAWSPAASLVWRYSQRDNKVTSGPDGSWPGSKINWNRTEDHKRAATGEHRSGRPARPDRTV